MADKTTIYRVAVRRGRYQGGGVTFWTWEEPLYTGVDDTQARVAYYHSEQSDHDGNGENPCRETVLEEITE